ncbi:hypothetical protein BJ165DRAFT_1406570 [Panaeolus papilionaceus]|nr:hypothetical protein BJ165DRAFT_1406570 [Panaeolus papilionaceus]
MAHSHLLTSWLHLCLDLDSLTRLRGQDLVRSSILSLFPTVEAYICAHSHAGGNWGWLITRPEKPNFLPTLKSSPYNYLTTLLTPYTEAEKEGLKCTAWFLDEPVGLLAWIYEKLVKRSDGYNWEDDDILTWISIYLFSTAGPAASSRIYYEVVNQKRNLPPPTIPKGQSSFPKEILVVPKAWLWSPYLVFTSEHKEGGHFAAHEKPDALVADLRTMFGRGGACGGIVKGREGY